MQCKCNQCNEIIELKENERANLRCNKCGGKDISLSKNVFLKCDLCNPCTMLSIQRRIIKADESFNTINKCANSRKQGQNSTYFIELIDAPKPTSKDEDILGLEIIEPKRRGRPSKQIDA